MEFNMIEEKKYTEKFYKSREDGSYQSAKEVLPLINSIFEPHSVVDIGCGVGDWLKVWHEEFGVGDILGIDGPYVKPHQLKIPQHFMKLQDLKTNLSFEKKYDLAMSLEVAEHLPETNAEEFVKSLTQASDIVVFAAAIIGQEGTFHINEQLPEYWAKIFLKYNYEPIDYIRPKIWNNEKIEWWYRQNILLYVKSDRIKDFPELKQAYQSTDPNYLFRVQPWLYLYKQNHIIKTNKFLGYLHWRGYLLKKKIFKIFGKE